MTNPEIERAVAAQEQILHDLAASGGVFEPGYVTPDHLRNLLEQEARASAPMVGEVAAVARIICAWYGHNPDDHEPGDLPVTDGVNPNKANEPWHYLWRNFTSKAEDLLRLLSAPTPPAPTGPKKEGD